MKYSEMIPGEYYSFQSGKGTSNWVIKFKGFGRWMNMNCVHCYASASKTGGSFYPEHEVLNTVSRFHDFTNFDDEPYRLKPADPEEINWLDDCVVLQKWLPFDEEKYRKADIVNDYYSIF